VTPERPDPDEQPIPSAAGEEPAESDDGEAYSEDEEAAVAARLEDLGYI
jgi:hypothetical protein